MLKANQTGGTGTITFPIYVDTPSTDPNVPAAASYALRFCAADRGVNVTEVDLDLVRLCTLRATQEERQRVMKHAVDGRAFYDDPVAFRLLDIEFHQSLNDAAGNRLLSAVAQGLYDIGLDVRRVASAMPGNIEKSVAQHIEVAEAVLAGDVAGACAAYRRHLEHVRDTTIEAMDSSHTTKD